MTAAFGVFRSVEEASGVMAPSAVTIGNFDGFHLGHQELLRRLCRHGARLGVKASLVTFDPHPAKVVAPHRAPRLLSTIEQRLGWMRAAGLEQALIVPFTEEFAGWSPEEFVERVLVAAARARLVLVGENFRFGRAQAGDTELLARLGQRFGFATEIVPGVVYRGRLVSSTAVRGMLDRGDVSWTARLLGRPYMLEGTVVSGHGIGSRQTVPTLNLNTAAEVLPASGVYITETSELGGERRWQSVTNVGYRPTFDGRELTVETFLLEPLGGETPRQISVAFHRRLRAERKFAGAAALKAQILRDVERARTYFLRRRRWCNKT